MKRAPRSRPIALSLLTLVGVFTMTTLSASVPQPSASILVGAYSGYVFPEDIDKYTEVVGAAPDIVMWFQNWEEPLYYQRQMAGISARDVTPMITWSPSGEFSMTDLLAGRHDAYITQQAHLAAQWGEPLLIRLFHEMNGTWMSYGPSTTTPEDFVRGWRRVVDIFRGQGVSNVSWVWTPNITGDEYTTAVEPLYPGHAYADWVGLDGYNFGRPWRSWRSLFEDSYRTIVSFTDKPFIIAEWGSAEDGGEKDEWITDFFRELPEVMPEVDAVVSFNRVAEGDFRIDSSPEALAAYRAAMRAEPFSTD